MIAGAFLLAGTVGLAACSHKDDASNAAQADTVNASDASTGVPEDNAGAVVDDNATLSNGTDATALPAGDNASDLPDTAANASGNAS